MNNLNNDHPLFLAFCEELKKQHIYKNYENEDFDVVDTKDTIQNFIDNAFECKIAEDKIIGGMRFAILYVRTSNLKNSLKHLFLMSDENWTLCQVD